jgi:hypothetical protein
MTLTQEIELTKIIRGALTLNEYLRLSRVGCKNPLNRKEKLAIYQLYLDYNDKMADNRKAMLKNRLSDKGQAAYNAICKHRDEEMLITA